MFPSYLNITSYVGQSIPFLNCQWSFGVVLWEIATRGGTPFCGQSQEEVYRLLQEGERLEQPRLCSVESYELMCLCWEWEPSNRPQFEYLLAELRKLLEQIPYQHAFVLP